MKGFRTNNRMARYLPRALKISSPYCLFVYILIIKILIFKKDTVFIPSLLSLLLFPRFHFITVILGFGLVS